MICRHCGRGIEQLETAAIVRRIREVIASVPPRKYDPSESDEQRRERTADYDQTSAIHMRVTFGLLADQLDGVCAFCSKVGTEEE